MTGHRLLAYASYLPVYRLDPKTIGARAPRVVASFDEDAITMAVAAARSASLRAVAPDSGSVLLATSSPPYLDKTNATAAHAALGLGGDWFAADLIGTGRSAIAALRQASTDGGWALLADVRVGRPGSADEKTGADGAVAFLFGPGDGIAELVATASVSAEFLDRWREPTSAVGQQWEERFGATRYTELIGAAASNALERAAIDQADHVVVSCPNPGVRKAAASLVKGRLSTAGLLVGFTGAADPGLALASVLDHAEPGETVLLLSATDGCDALVLRMLPGISERRQPVPLATQLEAGRPVDHVTYLSWRGLVAKELPRRPEPDRPAGPPSARAADWKFGFTGSRCTKCGFVHLPPLRVCRGCGAQDAMEPASAGRLHGTVATFTVDRLAYSPSPPVVDVVVDFEGGGRCAVEVADALPDELEVGSPVELCFRRLFTAGGVHNYFWKARQDG